MTLMNEIWSSIWTLVESFLVNRVRELQMKGHEYGSVILSHVLHYWVTTDQGA